MKILSGPEKRQETGRKGMSEPGRDPGELCRPFKKFRYNPSSIDNTLKGFQQGHLSDEVRTG